MGSPETDESSPLPKDHQRDGFFEPQRRTLRWDGVYCALLGLTLVSLGIANVTVSTFPDNFTLIAGAVIGAWAVLLLVLSRFYATNPIVGAVAGVNMPAAAVVAGLGITSRVDETLAAVVAVQIAAFAVHQIYVVLTAKVALAPHRSALKATSASSPHAVA